jgi:hypothetical protein
MRYQARRKRLSLNLFVSESKKVNRSTNGIEPLIAKCSAPFGYAGKGFTVIIRV